MSMGSISKVHFHFDNGRLQQSFMLVGIYIIMYFVNEIMRPQRTGATF